MAGRSSRIGLGYLFCAVLLIALTVFNFMSFKSRGESSPERVTAPIIETSASLRNSIFDFATANFFQEQESKAKILSIYECDENGACTASVPAANPTQAWALLFLAQAVNDFAADDTRRHQQASELLNKVFTSWVRSANGFDERFSVHQLYELARVTKKYEYLFWLQDRRKIFRVFADEIIKNHKGAGSNTVNSYLIATLAREIGLGIKSEIAFSRNEATAELSFDPGAIRVITDSEREDLYRLTELFSIIQHDWESGLDDSYNPLYREGENSLHQLACFQAWALSSILPLVEELQDNTGKKILANRNVDALIRFLSLIKDIPDEKLHFETQQAILPCIAAAGELREFIINAPEVAIVSSVQGAATRPLSVAELSALIEKLFGIAVRRSVIVKADCRPGRGFVSSLKQDLEGPEECRTVANLSDNSWMHYLLGQWAPDLKFEISRP